jgi:hypothetical protein
MMTEDGRGVSATDPEGERSCTHIGHATYQTDMNRETKMNLAALLLWQQSYVLTLTLVVLTWIQSATVQRVSGVVRRMMAILEKDQTYYDSVIPNMSDTQYEANFRMTRDDMEFLVDRIESGWPNTTRDTDITTRQALSLFITGLSTQASCREVANQFGVSRSTVCDVTARIGELICRRFGPLIQLPQTAAEWRTIGRRWSKKSMLINPVGAIDGVHIRIAGSLSTSQWALPGV